MGVIRLILPFILAVPAAAAGSAGLDQTFGSSGYRGTRAKATLDWGSNTYVAPSFSTYRTDSSSGSHHRFGARVGVEAGPLEFGVQGSVSPKAGGYGQQSLGGDVTLSLKPGGKQARKMAGPSAGEGSEKFGTGVAAVDVGAGFYLTRHSDELERASSSGPGGRRAPGRDRGGAFAVIQRDFSVFAGARVPLLEASAELTKSAYSKDLDAANARDAQFLRLPGVFAAAQGFPDTTVNVLAKAKVFPLVRPYASYTRTSFKLGQSDSHAYEFGATLGLDMVNLRAAYERYAQKGFASQNYFTLGASVNF